MPKTLSTPDRLALLLDWLNDDDWERSERGWHKELPHRLTRFVASFDGSEAAGYVRAEETRADTWARPSFMRESSGMEWADDEHEVLSLLHTFLVGILGQGFPSDEPLWPEMLGGASLGFGIERLAPLRSKGRERRRLAKRAGAYVLRVAGPRFDLVTWLVMHLLTLPGAIALVRCDAPQPHSPERCGRFFIPLGRGRPPDFCSGTCRQRKYWESDREDDKGRAAAKRRKRRRQKQ